MNREQAWELLHRYTTNPALIRHGQCVEAAMRHYARLQGADEASWGLAGLLHDFDYERYPEPPQHTREGAAVLRREGCDEEVVAAILSHVPWNLDDYPRDRPIRRTLFACDELCGFVYAAALVRPQRLEGMEPGGVLKKLKQKSFAAAVSRADIQEGAALLDVPLEQHIAHCIVALQSIASELGLSPQTP
ncbi:MAG: HDIG domain-containing protein [Planctomycetes bacterium]|nr:HDIG domain-containing protein [Planctomycetota bacterium]